MFWKLSFSTANPSYFCTRICCCCIRIHDFNFFVTCYMYVLFLQESVTSNNELRQTILYVCYCLLFCTCFLQDVCLFFFSIISFLELYLLEIVYLVFVEFFVCDTCTIIRNVQQESRKENRRLQQQILLICTRSPLANLQETCVF